MECIDQAMYSRVDPRAFQRSKDRRDRSTDGCTLRVGGHAILTVKTGKRQREEQYRGDVRKSSCGSLIIRASSQASSFSLYLVRAKGRTIARWYPCDTYSRKVRAPLDKLPGNAWAQMARAIRDGKCHREQTAFLRDGKGETVW